MARAAPLHAAHSGLAERSKMTPPARRRRSPARRFLGWGLLLCAACAAGEEIDLTKIGKPTTTAGSGAGGAAGTGGMAAAGGGGTTGGSGGSATGGTGAGGTGGSGGGSTGGSGGVTGGSGGVTGGSGGSATGGTGGTGGGGGARDAGNAGTGGTVPTGGTGGTGGTSGTGGSGGGTTDASTAGLHVLYAALKTQTSSPYVQCELHAKNNGSTPAQVSELKLRYYFTDEVKKAPQIMINWSHVCAPGNCSHSLTVTSAVMPNVPPAASADSYIEFGFSSGRPSLGPGDSADFTFQMQGPNPASDLYTQTNDYSFDGAKTALSPWPNIVLLQNGMVVWGMPP
jgi:hypothetical protein